MRPRGAYYNEIDPAKAAWLRELIKAELVAPGEVDERSIADVQVDDVRGFTQCHWFAGVGGWSRALFLAGWPDERPVWTGSCPCQRLSSATRGRAVAADLWPEFRRLIADARPGVVFGEQVALSAAGWVDRLCDDMEALGYTIGAGVLPAVSVGHDHARPRFYFAGHTHRDGQSSVRVDAEMDRLPRSRGHSGDVVRSHGVSARVVALSGFGNAIVPNVAAEFIGAYLEIEAERLAG